MKGVCGADAGGGRCDASAGGRTSRDACSGAGSHRLSLSDEGAPPEALLLASPLLAGGRWRHETRATRSSAPAASSAT